MKKLVIMLAIVMLGACGAPVNSSKYKPPADCNNPKVRVKHVDTKAALEQFYIEQGAGQ